QPHRAEGVVLGPMGPQQPPEPERRVDGVGGRRGLHQAHRPLEVLGGGDATFEGGQPSSKFSICLSSIFFCWNLRFRYPAVAIIGIMNTNMSEYGLRVIENMKPPMRMGANSMKIGKNCGCGSLGGVGAFRGRYGKRGTTRGERLNSTTGELGAVPPRRCRAMTAKVVCPISTVSEGPITARWTCSPPSTTPLEEWRSTISIESPTLMRACRLESIGSAILMSRSPSRPTTLEPDGSGNSRPASGPESTRSRATAAPRDSDRVAYSVEDLAIETMLPERSPAWIRSTSRSSERTPFAPGPAPGSWTWRVRPSGASASPRSGSAW